MLHGALSVEELWQAINGGLRTAITFHHVSMALLPNGNSPGVLRVSNPVANLRLYAAKIEAMAPVYGILTRNPNACVVRLSDELPIEAFSRTPFYKNFMKPEGWRYSASMIFREDGRMLGRLCLNRRADQGDFTDKQMVLLNALYVHFNVAVQRVCRFAKERKAEAGQAQNESDNPATLLLDERYAPVFHNRAAARICAVWRLGREQTRILKTELALPAEIREACEDLRTEWQKRNGRLAEAQCKRTVTHHGGLSATVQIFNSALTAGETRFLIHLSNEGLPKPDASVMARLSRLTATELAVANLVALGLDNQQVATELSISVNTVRAHLHNIFHKLQLDSRGKLGVLLRLAVL
jgi:DNA-binding CsgD family transcriptional regulator